MPKTPAELKAIAEKEAKFHLEGYEFLSVSEEYADQLSDDELTAVHRMVIYATPTIN